MTPRNRSGLTLIEVLVVLVVVGFLLLVIVVPFVNHARSESRRDRCMNQQMQLSQALGNYEARHGHFPGYANRLDSRTGGKPVVTSWIVPILPHLDRQDLYDKWQDGIPTSPYLESRVCPEDRARCRDRSLPWLGYVVNCGLAEGKDTRAEGVFHNHNVDAKPVTVSLDYISQHDGTTNTLLLSENLQAGLWTDTDKANVGMVWWREPADCNRINGCIDVGPRPQDIKYARPSSYHEGIVNAAFCDGHQQQLSEDIDYEIYQRLMAVDDEAAGLPFSGCKVPLW
jgi:prepilin-type N-terminal cleavage/methylation domain-containing protein/prepilin-type processing-associated H-X9-DG protein